MNKAITYICITFLLFIVVTGFFINSKEHIPDNAKIYILQKYRTWIPNAEWSSKVFQEQAAESKAIEDAYNDRFETTYSEIKNGSYKDFKLPESWQVGDYEQRIFWGSEESLLRSWILPKKKRWTNNGTWNW